MSLEIKLPLQFSSPVLASLMEANPGKQHFGNSVRCRPGDPTDDIDQVLAFNYQVSREKCPQLTGNYQRWDDTVELDGETFDLHGWFEAV